MIMRYVCLQHDLRTSLVYYFQRWYGALNTSYIGDVPSEEAKSITFSRVSIDKEAYHELGMWKCKNGYQQLCYEWCERAYVFSLN